MKVPKIFLFDILALDQESLCHLDLMERRTHLRSLVSELQSDGLIKLAETFPVDPDNFEQSVQSLQQ